MIVIIIVIIIIISDPKKYNIWRFSLLIPRVRETLLDYSVVCNLNLINVYVLYL